MKLDCGHEPTPNSAPGTGYGRNAQGRTRCYACCAEDDKAYMREHGRITLYLTHETEHRGPDGRDEVRTYYATNWPGTLRIRIGGAVRHSKGRGFGRAYPRTDVWFTFEGTEWHGVNVGDSQILRCKRLKTKR